MVLNFTGFLEFLPLKRSDGRLIKMNVHVSSRVLFHYDTKGKNTGTGSVVSKVQSGWKWSEDQYMKLSSLIEKKVHQIQNLLNKEQENQQKCLKDVCSVSEDEDSRDNNTAAYKTQWIFRSYYY